MEFLIPFILLMSHLIETRGVGFIIQMLAIFVFYQTFFGREIEIVNDDED